MTDTAESAPVEENNTEDKSNADVVAKMVESPNYDFVLDKYRADGRTEQDAALEQAKAYVDLQKKFGSFQGAPEVYELQLSEALTEKGFELDTDDPLYQEISETVKEMGMNNEGFNKLMNLYAASKLAEQDAYDQKAQEELSKLPDGERRIENLTSYFKANFDSGIVEALDSVPFSAPLVQVLEAAIANGRPSPMSANDAEPAAAMTDDKLKEMQFATNEQGQRLMDIDPDYRARYREALRQARPGENRIIVG